MVLNELKFEDLKKSLKLIAKRIKSLLKNSLKTLMPTFRSLLRSKGITPPPDRIEILKQLSKEFDLEENVFVSIILDEKDDELIED